MAERVFRCYFSRMSAAIQSSTDQLVREFFSSKLITWEVMDRVFTTPGLSSMDKSSIVLSCMDTYWHSTREKNFKTLCRVMKSFRELESLAEEMTERFGKCIVR